MVVKENNEVEVEYTGKLDSGEIFDSNTGKQPLRFSVGGGQVIPGFENAVVGMSVGETKKIRIEPKDAYGDKNPEMEREIPKESLPKGQEPKEGMILVLSSPDGQKFPVKISKVKENSITLDMNHPLAGQNLNFEIKLLNIISKD
jgi:FKBP-type peptidyl-prolyl cis-trans isomerase 2